MKYSKPPFSPEQHVALWQSRGLSVPDPAEATHHLKTIGYYRLSGYSLPLQIRNDLTKPPHTFKPGTTFKDILRLYLFDRELRLLVMDAVERIEVAFRASLSNHMSVKYGAFWYMDKALFHEDFDFYGFMGEVQEDAGATASRGSSRGTDVFLRHYFATYSDPPLPPSWMVVEVVPFSRWSSIFKWLKQRSDKKALGDLYGLQWETLASWIHAVSYVRNLCAHHSHLWNKDFTITPSFADHPSFGVTNNTRFYAQSVVLNHFMKRISPNTRWGQRLLRFIEAHPYIDPMAMGFSKWVQNIIEYEI